MTWYSPVANTHTILCDLRQFLEYLNPLLTKYGFIYTRAKSLVPTSEGEGEGGGR